MRRLIGLAAAVLTVAAAGPAWAQDIGDVTLFITSPWDGNPAFDADGVANGTIVFPGGVIPATLPIEVLFSATVSGVDGPNNGVSGIVVDVTGSLIAGVSPGVLTGDPTFTDPYLAGGLGFDLLPGGAGGVVGAGVIAGIGNAQALPGGWNHLLDSDNAGHPGGDSLDGRGAGPVRIASGNITPNTGLAPGTYSLNASGNANLWAMGFGSVLPPTNVVVGSLFSGSPPSPGGPAPNPPPGPQPALTVIVLPEPGTALLCALGTAVLLRKRRGGG